jgi:hypothetical protein
MIENGWYRGWEGSVGVCDGVLQLTLDNSGNGHVA